MSLNLIKLCVGIESIEHLARCDRDELKALRAARKKPELIHRTRMFPRRAGDILPGGSLYWVIKGLIQVRQPLLAIREAVDREGVACCDLVFANELVPVRPTPRRAFQGWRYLEAEDAPPDLGKAGGRDAAAMPPGMRAELAALGLL
jgi:hypothetical protein